LGVRQPEHSAELIGEKMATTQVQGLDIVGRKQPLPIGEEGWGILGPVHTKWVNLHVYWVLPLGVVAITLLTLSAFDAFDQKKVVLVSAPVTSSKSTSSQEQGMTTATVKQALVEVGQILAATDKVRSQVKSMVQAELPPTLPALIPAPQIAIPLPKTNKEQAESAKPEPSKVQSVWDLDTNK